jgi:multidrug efflux system membrane fusion protein
MNDDHRLKYIATGLLGVGLLALAVVIGWSSLRVVAPVPQSSAPAVSSPVSVVNGVTMVKLDAATQSRSGVAAETLAAITRNNAGTVYGTVIDLQPLIDLRSRHDAAGAEVVGARAAAAASRAELARSRTLYEDQHNVSLKAYQAAQAADRTNQAKADAAVLQLRNIEASAQQQFGADLARWALDRHSSAFARLVGRKDVLVRLTLPPGAGTQTPPHAMEVQASGSGRHLATLLSPAARSDPGMAGSSFLYRVGSALPTGAPVVGFLPNPNGAKPGTFVPSGAVVWYAGQPWVYVQSSAAMFARRPLENALETDGGYTVTEGLQPGERVVTHGAGLLLSEEQRPPPGGAGCKDPECD